MKEMAIMLATMMPEEVLINEIEDAVKDYKEAKLLNSNQEVITEKRRKLVLLCMMLTMREQTEGDIKKSFDLMQDMEEIEKAQNIFKKTN